MSYNYNYKENGSFGSHQKSSVQTEERPKTDTEKHIATVNERMREVKTELGTRAIMHDASKLVNPELKTFDEYGPALKGLTYGSSDYKKCLENMAPALKHHYENNRHHPEHFENGVRDMSLIDLIEMLVDWKAATERHADGDLAKSLEYNQKRFNMSDELTALLTRTARDLKWIK